MNKQTDKTTLTRYEPHPLLAEHAVCGHCGHASPQADGVDLRFCLGCGARLLVEVCGCGQEMRGEDVLAAAEGHSRHCGGCGAAVDYAALARQQTVGGVA